MLRLPAPSRALLPALLLALMSPAAYSAEEVRNVVNFGASASTEVQQDWMTLHLVARMDGQQAQEVQKRLQTALDSATHALQARSAAGKLELKTGNFRITPRYGKDSRISGWQGHAEIIVEGSDLTRITASSQVHPDFSVQNIRFSLAPATQRQVEATVEAAAIRRFQDRARTISQGFGFSGYRIRELSIHGNEYGARPSVGNSRNAMRLAAAPIAADSADTAGFSAEPGKTEVSININGSILMQ